MSGHSKWSTIKRKKGAKDAARGKAFAKLIRVIEVAAREGGGDPESNPSLATAIAKARGASMPNDNIQRAIKRGTGEIEGMSYEEASYEGYAPGGVAVFVTVLTDNRRRAAADVRSTFTKNNGSLGEPGSVAWKFEKKGVVQVAADGVDEDEFMLAALDAGAEDVLAEGDTFEVRSEPGDHNGVVETLRDSGYRIESSEVTMLPQQTTAVDAKTAPSVLRLMDALEDLDDVQDVYADFDISDDVMAELG